MEVKLGGNGIEYTYLEDGSYFWKAVPVKRKVVEEPQIRAVVEIERNYSEAFDKRLRSLVRDIARYLQ